MTDMDQELIFGSWRRCGQATARRSERPTTSLPRIQLSRFLSRTNLAHSAAEQRSRTRTVSAITAWRKEITDVVGTLQKPIILAASSCGARYMIIHVPKNGTPSDWARGENFFYDSVNYSVHESHTSASHMGNTHQAVRSEQNPQRGHICSDCRDSSRRVGAAALALLASIADGFASTRSADWQIRGSHSTVHALANRSPSDDVERSALTALSVCEMWPLPCEWLRTSAMSDPYRE